MKSKNFLSLLLAAALVLALLPATLLAEDAPAQDSGEPVLDSGKTQDGGDLPTLSIDVDGVSNSGATLTFTADAGGTVYYTLQPSDEQAPDEDAILGGETIAVTAGSAATVTVDGLSAQTGYAVYGVLEDDAGDRSTVVSMAFTTEAEPPAMLMGAAAPTDSITVHLANLDGDFIIENGTNSGTLKFICNGITMLDNISSDTIIFTGSPTLYSVKVASGVTANITLDNLNIDLSASGKCAFELQGTANVTLTLADGTSNSLASSSNFAGFQVAESATLTIGGAGALTAAGGNFGAGIGGGHDGSGGTITITGGTVNTTGSEGGAGIGGGYEGSGGTITIDGGTVNATGSNGGAGIGGGGGVNVSGGIITITGGTVDATGGHCGAGIGGGDHGNGGTVYISGGTVNATGGNYGAGIGGGLNGSVGTITITGGTVTATGGTARLGISGGGAVYISGGSVKSTGQDGGAENTSDGTLMNKPAAEGGVNVYRTTLTLAPDIAVPETDIDFSGSATGYGKKDLKTDDTGKLYFYLPTGDASAAYGGNLYIETVEAAHTNAFALPAVITTTTVDNVTGQAGQAVNLTAHVADNSGTPVNEGQVEFMADGVTAGTVNVTGGTAILNWTIPSNGSLGIHVITAKYLGISGYLTSSATSQFTIYGAPTVETGAASNVTASGAALSGNVLADGGAAVTARGFVYGTSVNPTIGGAGVVQVASGSGTGAFTAALSNLSDGTTYHVRAYATNSAGTSYGADVAFTTQSNGGSSDDSGSGGRALIAAQSDRQPNQPVIAGFSVNPTVDSNGHATAIITQTAVSDAIAKALADAQAQGRTTNGVGVSVNIALPDTAQSLSVTLSRAALKSLIDAGVRQLTINGRLVSLNLDLEALREIFRQSAQDVTLTVKPAQNLSTAAKALIGARPVYDITISYVRDGRTVNVTSLGKGRTLLSIPYTPGAGETAGWLFGVYVDGSGQAARISGSAYDANSRNILLGSNHFSVYGVGYITPSEKYTDIRAH